MRSGSSEPAASAAPPTPAAHAEAPAPGSGDVRLFWAVIAVVLALDVATKRVAEQSLVPRGIPHEVWGDVLRWTLVYNPGAAFGLHLGPYSRWIFTALTIGALFILWRLLTATRRGDTPRVLAIALVTSGAIGNLIDRLRSSQGVVDFIDVGIGAMRWPTFNVADIAVTCGAIALAVSLWREDRRPLEADSARAG